MIIVCVAVDDLLHRLIRDVADCVLHVYADRGWIVDDDDSLASDEEHCIVGTAVYHWRIALAKIQQNGSFALLIDVFEL